MGQTPPSREGMSLPGCAPASPGAAAPRWVPSGQRRRDSPQPREAPGGPRNPQLSPRSGRRQERAQQLPPSCAHPEAPAHCEHPALSLPFCTIWHLHRVARLHREQPQPCPGPTDFPGNSRLLRTARGSKQIPASALKVNFHESNSFPLPSSSLHLLYRGAGSL